MKKSIVAGLGLFILTNIATAGVFDQRPDVIVCSLAVSETPDNWDKFVFYISGVRRDGSILYKSMTSNPVLVTADNKGLVSAANLTDCDQKTVSQLRQNGQAFDFKR